MMDWIMNHLRALVYWLGFRPDGNSIFYSPSREWMRIGRDFSNKVGLAYEQALRDAATRISCKDAVEQAEEILEGLDRDARELRGD